MFKKRHISDTIKKAGKQTKVVLLTGARQVGKSTLMKTMFPNYTYVTLDDENELRLAIDDRSLFFRDRDFPVIIDEAQYAKELLREIKRVVDGEQKKGQIFLTGSQTFDLLSLTAETLAGRVTILEMAGLSLREQFDVSYKKSFLPTASYIRERERQLVPYKDIWLRIHRGSMPELLDKNRDWEWFYRDYVRTYIERDIRRIVNVKDEMKFRDFLTALAARSGQMLVFDDIARDIGVTVKTVQHWTSVIRASGLVHILHPYHHNVLNRVIKTPKLFFMDTGLLCYLVGWKSAETAKNGAMSGNIFETFVVSEILKSRMNAGEDLDSVYYYRDKDKKEIDLIIADENILYPIEIKSDAAIKPDWGKNFSVLSKLADKTIARGTVLCRAEKRLPVNETVSALPMEYL